MQGSRAIAAWLEEDGRRPGSLTSRQTRVVFKKVELVFWERNALTSPHLGGPQRQDRALGKQLPACTEEGLFTVSWSRQEGVAGGGDLTRPPPMCVCCSGAPLARAGGLGAPWFLSSSPHCVPVSHLGTGFSHTKALVSWLDSSRILLHAWAPEGPAHSLEL